MSAPAVVERLLLADPRVQDAVLVGSGSGPVVWVVPRRPVRTEELAALLQRALGGDAPEVALIDALPLTADGAPDVASLAARTAPTPAWRRRLEEQLRGAGLEAVAVVGRPTRHEAFEPLDELLPRELLPRLFEDSAPPPSSAGAAPVSGARPSLVVGPARERPPGAPAVLTELLRDSAQRFPARTVTFIDAAGRREVLTFRELWEEGLAFCGGLQAAGLRSGEFLVFQLRSPRAFVTAFWGCALGGIIPVPVACPPAYDAANPLAARLVSISERLQRPWLLADGADAAGAEALGLRVMRCASVDRARAGTPAPLEPGDTALLPFTSGSTGVPKAVVLSHDNLIAMGEGMVRGGWHHPEDHPVSWMSLDHPAALANPHLVSLRTGSPHVLVARDYVLADVLRWLDLVTELRATSSWAPNFAFGLINDRLEKGERRAWDLGPMRTLTTAGEFVVPGTMRRLVELLAPYGLRRDAVCPGWGMAETSSFYCFERGVREDSAGAFVHLGGPMVGGEMRIVNDGDEVVPEGTVGHLQVRGAAVLARYLNAPEVNASSFTPDGWFRTGDLALMREGSVALTGREKEMLIIGGANVFPYEIETVVDAVEGVLPSYTIACGTREAGAQTDSILLFFALAPGAPPLGQVLRGIRERVGRVLGFSVSILVPLERGQIPRTELGKKGRTELKRRFEAGEFLAERRRVDRILGGPATMPRCLAVPRWAPRPQPRGEGPARALLLAGEEGLTAALRAKAGPGRRVIRVTAGPHAEPLAEGDGYQVDVRTPGAAARVLEALEARGVPVEDVVLAPPALEGSPARAAAALMAWALPWVQALAVRAAARPVRLFAALPEVEGPSGPGVARLLLPGLLWSAAAEQPGLEVRVLWVPPDAAAAVEGVLAETVGARAAREVAFRDGARLERAFVPWTPAPVGAPRRLARGGLYLVTGALGGLGSAWARHLRKALDARLLLVGRRPRDAGAEALERELVQAAYEPVDVTDGAALSEAVRRAEARFGRPIDGAFHFAGVVESRGLEAETPGSLVRGASAHALGAVAVAEALRERPSALLVFASSLMGTLGAGQHAAYCAGTGFVERFAGVLQAAGRPAVAVSLSGVRRTGLARALQALAPGYRWLEPSQALAALALAAEGPGGQLLAGVHPESPVWRAAGLGEGTPLEQLHLFITASARELPAAIASDAQLAVHPVVAFPRAPDGSVDLARLAGDVLAEASSAASSDPLERAVAEVFREVLGTEVDAGSDFLELGGSSLQATRVVSRIAQRLGVQLSVGALFEYPSVAHLAAHLRSLITPREGTA